MPEALLWTLGSFALILLLARVRVPLFVAIFAGAGMLAAAFTGDPRKVASAFLFGTINPSAVALMIIVAMLLTLSELMREAGQLERIVGLARQCLRRPAVSMAAMPMLIGLIPMPGGALFSASMVQTAAGDTKVSGGRLSAINYWYRHIWEYWWPLYPGVLLASEQARTDVGTIAVFNAPLTLFMGLAGLWIFRRTHPDLHVAAPAPQPGTAKKLLLATSSIWIIIIGYAVTRGLLALAVHKPTTSVLAAIVRYLPVGVGLIVSIAWTMRLNRLGGKSILRTFTGRSVYTMVLLVLAVMVFQYTMKRVDAASSMAKELRYLGFPPVLVVGILPFIAGIVTGWGVGFVGASFPIVLPLVGFKIPYLVLAFACGHMGMMLSPVHLCHVVSNRFFKTSFGAVYRHIIPAGIVTVGLAVVYFVILRMFLGG